MRIASFARESFVRERYPVDATGEVDFSAPPETTTVTNCSIQPGASLEVLDGREALKISWTIWAPLGADVHGRDFARINGQLHRVVGEPQPWKSPTGRLSHLMIYLERWEG